MTEARTITLTLTRGQYDALALAAFEGADSPDMASARDALERAWEGAEPGAITDARAARDRLRADRLEGRLGPGRWPAVLPGEVDP